MIKNNFVFIFVIGFRDDMGAKRILQEHRLFTAGLSNRVSSPKYHFLRLYVSHAGGFLEPLPALPVEKDLQMLKDLGLDPNWDSHDFSDQEEGGCGCGKEKREEIYAKA